MLCAFPERYCLIQSEAGAAENTNQVLSIENMSGGGEGDNTVVYRVPGVELVIGSELVRGCRLLIVGDNVRPHFS
jgi:hypothetical protein